MFVLFLDRRYGGHRALRDPITGTFRKVGFSKIILLLESKESVYGAARATSKRRIGPDSVALSM